MKRHIILLALATLTLAAAADPPLELPATTAATMTQAEWVAYADLVSDALTDDVLQPTAVRMIIQYSAFIPLDRGDVFELVKLYRDNDNARMRRMAVVALGSIDDEWGIDYLARSFRYEDDVRVKHTVASVLLEHARMHRVIVGRPTLVWPVQ